MSRVSDRTRSRRARLAGMGGAAGNVAVVCLLIALSRTIPGMPLLVAANRDER